MDQLKIGAFIAERRKMKSLTQAQLAEKLNITDRAVSKWENGRSLPDASIMLELCEILDISVNDLLVGEVVAVDKYNKELENRLLEMIKEKKSTDRRLLKLEVVIGVLSTIICIAFILFASYAPLLDWQRILIIFSGLILALVGFFCALRIEQVAGYYECRHCNHKYVPTYKAVNFAPHMGRMRYMKCPECYKKSWQRKVVSKD